MTLDHNAVCENCWFWEKITTGHEVLGFCKRHAPIIVTSPPDPSTFASFTTTTLWPRTVAEDWCGDWEKNIPKMGEISSYPEARYDGSDLAPNPVPPEEYEKCGASDVPQCVCGDKPGLIWEEQSGTAQNCVVSCSCGRKSQQWASATYALLDWKMSCQKP